MFPTRSKLAPLLACLCMAMVLVTGCTATPAYENSATPKRCDPTGNAEQRRACNA